MTDNEVLTAADIAEQIRSGADEPAETAPPPPAPGGEPEEPSDEEFEKQWKDYEEGKGELPVSKKAMKRLFEGQKKTEAEIEKKFAGKFSEQEKKLKRMELGSLSQQRINLANEYKRRFVDEPEKAEKDFESPEKYRAYIKERDDWKAAFEEKFAEYTRQLEAEAAALESGDPGPGGGESEFRFKSKEDAERFQALSKAYGEKVPEFAEAAKRWRELPPETLDIITGSLYAPALLHAAIDSGWAKLPPREQVKAVYMLEAHIAQTLGQQGGQQPPANPPTGSPPPAEPKKPDLPAPPPKMRGSGKPPVEDVITAKDIQKDIKEGKI